MSTIEWTDETVNMVVGCTRVSPGCERCYAERFVHRGMHESHRGLTIVGAGAKGPRWNGKVRFLPERLTEPQRWKRGRRIFINSLSDTFHTALTHTQRLAIFGAFCMAPQHVYQVLTKRPEVALDFEQWIVLQGEREHLTFRELAIRAYCDAVGSAAPGHWRDVEASIPTHGHAWWIGVTAEDQQRANERIPKLLALSLLPTLCFVSYEPALGPVDFTQIRSNVGDALRFQDALSGRGIWLSRNADWSKESALGWVIVGGESGAGARGFNLTWGRKVLAQCDAAGVPAFFKQAGARPYICLGGHDNATDDDRDVECTGMGGGCSVLKLKHGKGADLEELPTWARVRQFPKGPS